MKTFASPSHKFGQLRLYGAGMAAGKSPIRSSHRCPDCGSPLFYVNSAFTFLTGRKKRLCLAAKCNYVEPRKFKIATSRQV